MPERLRTRRAVFAAWKEEVVLFTFGERQQAELREPRVGINDQPFARRQVRGHLSCHFNHIKPTEQTFHRHAAATVRNLFKSDSPVAAEKLGGFAPADQNDLGVGEFALQAIDDDTGDGNVCAECHAREHDDAPHARRREVYDGFFTAQRSGAVEHTGFVAQPVTIQCRIERPAFRKPAAMFDDLREDAVVERHVGGRKRVGQSFDQ